MAARSTMSSLRKGKSLLPTLVASALGFAEKIEATIQIIQESRESRGDPAI